MNKPGAIRSVERRWLNQKSIEAHIMHTTKNSRETTHCIKIKWLLKNKFFIVYKHL